MTTGQMLRRVNQEPVPTDQTLLSINKVIDVKEDLIHITEVNVFDELRPISCLV